MMLRRLVGLLTGTSSSAPDDVRRQVANVPARPAQMPPPRMPFEKAFKLADGIEGMMSTFSMELMDSLLSFQEALGIAGPVLEFGVYKGRSAALISAHVLPEERFILVDVHKYISDETLQSMFRIPEFTLGSSEDFASSATAVELHRKVRFMHVDSSHAYRTTLAEMRLAEQLLADGGILCLDDFANLHYSQVLPAVYKFLYTEKHDLCVFLVTNAKAYLCRSAYFDAYAGFVLDGLQDEMRARGNAETMLARTDADVDYRAFYLRPRSPGEAGDRYGPELYGSHYAAP
ncbi:class I SAM-dependent methyltransferase [Neoroseomonas rubea]|uniref:class I SAM-dependent methyltransferase n=1 Tax=Neoroseomonas rubea TaxID=2748666 RepID=UPI0018DEFF69|nr:class I SAM-dependent methyltransferase [Roseomonas rubea]